MQPARPGWVALRRTFSSVAVAPMSGADIAPSLVTEGTLVLAPAAAIEAAIARGEIEVLIITIDLAGWSGLERVAIKDLRTALPFPPVGDAGAVGG
jgi:hypothetical protein